MLPVQIWLWQSDHPLVHVEPVVHLGQPLVKPPQSMSDAWPLRTPSAPEGHRVKPWGGA
jgi:hypothetical protein